jgi:uncharacterized protein (TIGR02186 family)
MKTAVRLAAMLLAFATPAAAEAPPQETVQSDISTRDISIQSNFTGIEILIFGSIDFSDSRTPEQGTYDVIMVVRGPSHPAVVRRKERVAGIWMNGPSDTYSDVPGFYAVLSSRPLRAIASDKTLKDLGIGLSELNFGAKAQDDIQEQAFRSAMIRLKRQKTLFQEHDDGVRFIGRSLFRANVALPVNVPIGRYTVDVYLFHDGKLASKSQSSLQVTQAGFERVIYMLAFRHPFIYGVLAVVLAVFAGLAGWYAFRRD